MTEQLVSFGNLGHELKQGLERVSTRLTQVEGNYHGSVLDTLDHLGKSLGDKTQTACRALRVPYGLSALSGQLVLEVGDFVFRNLQFYAPENSLARRFPDDPFNRSATLLVQKVDGSLIGEINKAKQVGQSLRETYQNVNSTLALARRAETACATVDNAVELGKNAVQVSAQKAVAGLNTLAGKSAIAIIATSQKATQKRERVADLAQGGRETIARAQEKISPIRASAESYASKAKDLGVVVKNKISLAGAQSGQRLAQAKDRGQALKQSAMDRIGAMKTRLRPDTN